MKKLQSTLPNMVMSLGLITLIAGAMLGVVYYITKEPIAQMAHETQVAAIRNVAPEFTNDPEADKWTWENDGLTYVVYPAYNGDKLVGAAVESVTMSGFSGEVRIMCGFEADGTIRNYEVLSHAETPGLGSKMATWFSDPTGSRSVIGKNAETASLYVTKDADKNGEIEAITAATISSRAFLEAMRNAYEAFKQYGQTLKN